MGSGLKLVAGVVLLMCPLALTRHDDDFAFDNSEEFQVELQANHSEIAKNGLRRLWGVPDTSAYVGHLFRMEVPKEAFSGEVIAYKVRSKGGERTPSWLAVDSRHGLISGLPQHRDLGAHTFTVTAHGRTQGLTAKDSFTIEVKKAEEKPLSKYGSCVGNEDRLRLLILIDGSFHHIEPRQKIRALMELANFMALDGDEFSMEPYKDSIREHMIMSGPGNTSRKRFAASTAIYFNVGCGEKLWPRHKVLVAGVREQARDGTLSNVMRMPVLGWRLLAAKPSHRPKRQSPQSLDVGSGDVTEYDEDGEDDIDDFSGYDDLDEDNGDDEYTNLDLGPVPDLDHKVKITPYAESASESSDVVLTKDMGPIEPRRINFDQHSPVDISPVETTSTEPDLPTVIIRASNELPSTTPSEPPTVASLPTTEPDVIATSSSSKTTPTSSSTSLPTTTSLPPTTSIPPTTSSSSTTAPPPPPPPPSTTLSTTSTTSPVPPTETSATEVTQEIISTTEHTSTIEGRTTEMITFLVPTAPPVLVNQAPILKHHMKKLAITAGKAFRYIIPADLFTDPEGGNLTFTMYEADNVPLSANSWIQFIPNTREVYGLPLESHVSRWNFIVEAQDSEGLIARGPLDITVQQHKAARTINHQFVLQFTLNKNYTIPIDWQIRALEGIVNLFRDTDMDHLTVLNATFSEDFCEFVWTNDTLPKDGACPLEDINRLMKIMENESEWGSPTSSLLRAMSPELTAVGVGWRGAGTCGLGPASRARVPTDTYPPVTRNQVDHLTATVGHLLLYKVPEDTFFDPEDGATRNLQLSLRYNDRSPLPSGHWLQFDERNQEFYGLPASGDEGIVHYQLIAEDTSKKSAYDSLIVEVVKAPQIRPTVEFQMTIDPPPSPPLAYNANGKRKVVEKLAALFGQKETSSIRIKSITENPTTIIWYNTSLPMDKCPKSEIDELRKMIIADEREGGSLTENVDQVFDKDFKVMSIRLIPLNLCDKQDKGSGSIKTPLYTAGINVLNNKADSAAEAGYTEYLVTFVIPAVVIVCMILVASIIACVLYRRRRTGKMSVGDEEERQAFRSKGIPVIFQDELEERGDTEPVHKSPVIMREEKPPLLPPAPDYRNGEDAPYRPPPPFAASRTPPRPKATPTYRKPPPYVPP